MLIRHLRARRPDVAWLAFWSLVQALPIAASGWSLAEATGRFLTGDVVAGLAWLGLLAGTGAAGAFGTRQAYLRAGAIVEPLRDDLVTAVVEGALERSTTSAAAPPDTRAVARLTHQAEIVRDSCAGLLIVTATFACTAVSAFAGLITLVPATLPYVVPPLLVTGLLLRLMLRPIISRQRAAVLAEEEVAEEASRVASGLRDITACGAEDHVRAGLSARITRAAGTTRSASVTGSARVACLAFGGWLPLLLVLAAAPSMLGHGVSPGDIVGALTYITGTLRGALYAGSEGMGTGLVRLYVTLDRIQQTSASHQQGSAGHQQTPAGHQPASVPAPRRPRRPRKARASGAGGAGEIVLRDVRFAYGPHAAPVIDGLSMRIPPGDHLAVAGPSGIGKSSLAALIAGILSPSAGEVLVGGRPPASRGRDWRVLLPQEAYVFAGTLEENLAYYGPASRAEMEKAADAVGIVPFISALGGFEAPVAPEALSAGQRQLIALTRAYLSPAPVAILDEATCHLDPAAEEQAEEAFARRGGTLVVIAHRITSARRAQRILVLDGARAQAGRHDELLASSAMYRELAGHWFSPEISLNGH
jgi:ATP-binding cassette subfamily C protein